MERIALYIMGVKFTKNEMTEMENLLSDFLQKHDITLSVPVDIFALATELGFDVRGAEFKGDLEGLVLVNETVDKIELFNSNKIIAYNCQKSIEHKKFIVGHELAHYIEEKHKNPSKKIVYAARDHSKQYSTDTAEQRKDYLSAAMLMPKDVLIKEYKKKNIKNTKEICHEIADIFNVSDEMAKRRIEEVINA